MNLKKLKNWRKALSVSASASFLAGLLLKVLFFVFYKCLKCVVNILFGKE